jgi:hypothetical protein
MSVKHSDELGGGARQGGGGFHRTLVIRAMGVIPSFIELSTGALLLASCVQIALLTLLVGRSRRRRAQRYVQLPEVPDLDPEAKNPSQVPVQDWGPQQRAAWKGAMLRRFETGGQ